MSADAIFEKYWAALGSEEMTVATEFALVRFALRLAVRDAFDAGAALCDDMAAIISDLSQQTPDQRQAESDRRQLALVAEWLEQHEPALYHDLEGGFGDAILLAIRKRNDQIAGLQQEIAAMDADNAGLLAKLTAAEQGWAAAQADADRMALHVAQLPSVIHTNGNGVAAPGRIERDWRVALSATVAEFVESLDTGRRAFRSVPKAVRLEILQAIMRSITDDGMPSMISYDAARPSWAPQSSGIPTTFGCSWLDLLTLDPAAVAA